MARPGVGGDDGARAAFTIFLQEGDRYTSEPPSHAAREAIAGAVFEIGYQQMHFGRSDLIPRMTPHAVYLVLAPFMGAKRASKLVEAKLRACAG